jgi:hypothetical protein
LVTDIARTSRAKWSHRACGPACLKLEEIIMTVNEGTVDRAIRIIAGLGLLSLVVVGPKTLWGLVGLVPLATGLIGWCPAYSLFGVRTCKVKTAK